MVCEDLWGFTAPRGLWLMHAFIGS